MRGGLVGARSRSGAKVDLDRSRLREHGCTALAALAPDRIRDPAFSRALRLPGTRIPCTVLRRSYWSDCGAPGTSDLLHRYPKSRRPGVLAMGRPASAARARWHARAPFATRPIAPRTPASLPLSTAP